MAVYLRRKKQVLQPTHEDTTEAAEGEEHAQRTQMRGVGSSGVGGGGVRGGDAGASAWGLPGCGVVVVVAVHSALFMRWWLHGARRGT